MLPGTKLGMPGTKGPRKPGPNIGLCKFGSEEA